MMTSPRPADTTTLLPALDRLPYHPVDMRPIRERATRPAAEPPARMPEDELTLVLVLASIALFIAIMAAAAAAGGL